ncbi:MAG TPA: Ig-like domain-containing protein, partial [Verrucomicrobiae bacterium]
MRVALLRARTAVTVCLCIIINIAADAFEPAKVAVDLSRPISGYALVNAFPGVTFNQPVAIVSAPGETNRLFVVERDGVVCVITNLAAPNRSVFLDLRTNTDAANIELGLLGLAFHPNFQTNGQFFVFRTTFERSLTDRLSRFRVSAADPNIADPTETILINQADLSETHNAGDLHFGPDGYLYVSVGDEGPLLADRGALPQSIEGGLFGGILRIDVDQRPSNLPPPSHPSVIGNYSIPADNPFVGARNFLGLAIDPARVRTEFFAVGLRNPWRFTIDSQTGDILAGEVGLGIAEEINLITKGGNYGWPFREGVFDGPSASIAPTNSNFQPSLHEFIHGKSIDRGECVIGGIVCRNASISDLEGWYIFGDEGSGNIWKLRTETPADVRWVAREPGIVAFGRDPATGDVLIANLTRGEIRRLVYSAPEEERIPSKLSATGIFTNLANLAPAAGIVPYDINVSFWSDNALKHRWFGLMNGGSKVLFSPTENWSFPDGAVWVKHFELEMERGNPASARRVETRLLIKAGDQVHGFTYQWDDAGQEANLVGSSGVEQQFTIKDPNGTTRVQTWIFPPRGDCAACHSKGGGGPLGFNTAQLNLEHTSPQTGAVENQLDGLFHAGYLQAETVDAPNLPALAKATDTVQPLDFRVKSYLSANCSQCHRPDGVWGTRWDARWTTPISQSRIIGVPAIPLDDNDWRIIAPHSPESSTLYRRISEQDAFRMPPIASTVLDQGAQDLIRQWIACIPDSTLTEMEIGAGTLRGSLTQSRNYRRLSGIGNGLDGVDKDRLHFAGRTLKRGGYVTAHISAIPGARPGMRAGVMICKDDATNGPAVWLARGASGQNALLSRTRAGDSAGLVATGAAQAKSWMRLIRQGNEISAWESADNASWQKIGQADCNIDSDALAGVAVASGENWRFATAEFDSIQTLSVSVELNDPAPYTALPRDLILNAIVETNGVALTGVKFIADGQVIGSVSAPPWQFRWTNAWAGSYDVVAVAIDQNGLAVCSELLRVNLFADPPVVEYLRASSVSTNWQSVFGTLGQAIPGVVTNLPGRASLKFEGTTGVKTYSEPGLLRNGDSVIPATAWIDQNEIRVAYDPGNEIPHRLSLFFAPYGGSSAATVTFRDPLDETILSEQVVTNFNKGSFVSWDVRGAINIGIRAGGTSAAILSGVFLDPLSSPTVQLRSVASPVTLPATIQLQAQASAEGRGIRRVEFWDGEIKIGETAQAPFDLLWTNAYSGEHSVIAVAVGEYGLSTQSTPMTLRCELPPNRAAFVSDDWLTQGDWIGRYGAEGQELAIGWTNLNPRFEANIQSLLFPVVSDNTDRSSLQIPLNDYRFLGYYFVGASDTMELRIRTRDGRLTRFSLYFADWFGPGRKEEVTVLDGATGVECDRRVIESFYDGVYLSWNIQGDLRFLIHSVNDFNAVVSGLFFDPPAPEIAIATPADNSVVILPAAIPLEANVVTNDAVVTRVEFFADQKQIGSITNEPYRFSWTNAMLGDHKIFARAIAPGLHSDSKPVTIHCALPTAQASFTG